MAKKTLLRMIQDACNEMGIPAPDFIFTNTDPQVVQLLALANREGDEISRAEGGSGGWPALMQEWLFTFVNGVSSYSFPTDYAYLINSTGWDRSFRWQIEGPLSPQEWQVLKSGISISGPRTRFRIKDNMLFVDPVPSVKPSTPIASITYSGTTATVTTTVAHNLSTGTTLSFAGVAPAVYNGIYPITVLNQLSFTYILPSIPPSNATTVGGYVVSGDSIVFEYVSGNWCQSALSVGQSEWLADTDTFLLPDRLMTLGVKWRFKQAKGLDFSTEYQEYQQIMGRSMAHSSSQRNLMTNSRPRGVALLSDWQIPDTGFGTV